MIYDIQKASMLKRISAWLLDTILLLVLIAGLAGAISAVVGYDGYNDSLEAHYASYEKEYGVTFNITQEQYEALTPDKKEAYDAAYQALTADKNVLYVYNMLINLTLIIVTFSVLAGYLLLEFAVPLYLKNGQTVGKKVFGIAVVRTNCVRMNSISLFIRTVLGKFTIETMIPVLVVIMLLFNMVGLGGTILVFCLLAAQLALLIATKTNSLIHDKLADTVAVDLASQRIFESEEELLEFKKRVSAEEAAKKSYY